MAFVCSETVITSHLHLQEDIEQNGYQPLPGSSIAGSESDVPEIEVVPSEALFSRAWLEARPRIKVTLGVVLALLSGLIFTFNGSVMKGYGIDPVDFLAVRGAVQFGVLYLVCRARGIHLWSDEIGTKTKLMMILQGIMGGIGVITGLMSIMMIPLGDALTFIFSSPVFTCICSRIFLKHRLGLWKLVFIGSLVVGIVFVIQPPVLFPEPDIPPHLFHDKRDGDQGKRDGDHDDPDVVVHDLYYYMGALLAVSGAIICSFNNVCVSGTLKHINSMVLVGYVGAASFVISIMCTSFDKKQRIFSTQIVDIAAWEWALIIGMSILGIFAYFSVTKALQLIDPTVVSVLRSTEILLGFFIQVVFMHQLPDAFAIVGASIVFLSIIMIALEANIVRRLPQYVQEWL
ncbi:hypothetical protein TCAL_07230 [Tigriopus californicus]|uniref:EamA domain-containing protein n=1 Tax=Tigriopus californicus TaxID=6832 RepID=A0A553NPF3_TIGCA|nr:solute carrier family 35 member G1-like [Tigriopus californicus]TRY67306.1 hypothetical protein TCAL_07230 [Tigriopus californicus]|eukprot:TCALIF_07230-PA protein Name:"Similar to Slc35g1 Solute carrier family 35 member G1 (Mus musculus)" AED:0.40 eAED:0.42 QI:0/-1/0/1/-1/1/1/0/401